MKSWLLFILLLMLLPVSLAHAQDAPARSTWWTVVFPSGDASQSSKTEWSAIDADRTVLSPADKTLNAQVDKIREFISGNSVNKIDNEFYSYWADVPRMTKQLLDRRQDPKKPKVHLECAARSAVMYHMLHTIGVNARLVIVYQDSDEPNVSHTFVEVYNPETTNWEISDPLLDICWRWKESGLRASTEDLMSHPIKETFIPCHADGTCSYTKEIENMLPYFGMASVISFGTDVDPVLVNPNRYSLIKAINFNGHIKKYCNPDRKDCRQPLVKVWD